MLNRAIEYSDSTGSESNFRTPQVNPDAAASLREGLDDTLTVTRLGVTGSLLKTVMSTNPSR